MGISEREPLEPSTDGNLHRWLITTQSGSRYIVAQDRDGIWWLAGDNVLSPTSCSLQDGMWAVQQPVPWPPILGYRLWIEALRLPFGHPDRLPGGGKDTSQVVSMAVLQ